MESLDLVDEKVESVNGSEFDVLGGIFKRFKLQEWELEFARQFIANPFNCSIIGNIKRYASDVLDDWKDYNPHHLDWIQHLDTFLFWWSHTKSSDFNTYVSAVNFEQYDIADMCVCDTTENFMWPRSKLSEIKDIDKYLSYIDHKWMEKGIDIDRLLQFPINVTISLLTNLVNYADEATKFRLYIKLTNLLDNNLAELIPVFKYRHTSTGFKPGHLKYADILIKHRIIFHYNVADLKKLTDSQIETFLCVNKALNVAEVDTIYRVETIRRKMISEGKLEPGVSSILINSSDDEEVT